MEYLAGLLLFAALLVVGLAVGGRAERRKRAALTAWAASHEGWTYTPGYVATDLHQRVAGAPFGIGSDRRASHLLAGVVDGLPVTCFQYDYGLEAADAAHRQSSTVAVVALAAPAPRLELAAEGVTARLAKALGGQDVQLGDEELDRRYRVTTEEPAFAFAVLTPDVRARLLEDAPPNLRVEDDHVVCWSRGGIDADKVDRQVRTVASFAAAVAATGPAAPSTT